MSRVYKILTELQAAELEGLRRWEGTALDLADGFVHLSTAAQVEGTVRAYFTSPGPLLLLGFETKALDITWEAARSGGLYPHLYGMLPVGLAVLRVWIPVDRADFDYAALAT